MSHSKQNTPRPFQLQHGRDDLFLYTNKIACFLDFLLNIRD